MHDAEVHVFLRLRLVYGKRSDGRTRSQVHQKGMIISSNKGNLQGELMEKGFSSYCRCSVAKRTISCARSMSRFEEAKEKNGQTLSLQKLVVLIEFYFCENDERNSDFLKRNQKGGKAIFLPDAERNAAYFAIGSSPDTSGMLVSRIRRNLEL